MKINSLQRLADYLGVPCDADAVARYVYKNTESGVSCRVTVDDGVIITGYCEGDVGDCPTYKIGWGFTDAAFDEIVARADDDACSLWEETHGCSACGTWTNDQGLRRVNPKCPECQGGGRIL